MIGNKETKSYIDNLLMCDMVSSTHLKVIYWNSKVVNRVTSSHIHGTRGVSSTSETDMTNKKWDGVALRSCRLIGNFNH